STGCLTGGERRCDRDGRHANDPGGTTSDHNGPHRDGFMEPTVVRLAVIRPATGVVLLLFSVSLGTVAAQPPVTAPRVGYINPGSSSDPVRQRRFEAFRQGLRELGYVEGQNIVIESRWAEGQYDRYPALAADLVRSKVDVIVAVSGAATQAAQQATRTIPIV